MKKKKALIVTASVLAVLLIAYAVMALIPPTRNFEQENPMMKQELPILIAHGGGNREFPDNTLEAFYNAYSVDPRVMMETDVSITKDGVVILSHDVRLDRKTNVTGLISDWNYSDLISQRVDFGYTNPTNDNDELDGERKHFIGADGLEKYPTDVTYPEGVEPRDKEVFLATTLEELLVAFPESRINVEIKQSGDTGKRALTEILRLLEKYDAFHRVVLASFHEELYNEFKALRASDKVPDTFMFSPAYGGAITFYAMHLLGIDGLFGDKMCVFQLPMEQFGIDLATKEFVAKANSHNLAVHYWTVNDEDDMRHLISIGADGIMTDYPHRLKEVYDGYSK
ncbi:MAG: hypothetical protein IKK58_01590 [Clostridia bacterium]|nr:hypothetical protein [Clostridia bacterium]